MSTRPGVIDMSAQSAGAKAGTNGADVLHVLSFADVLGYDPPPGSLLVGDGLLELGENSLLYGPPGSFKSFAVGNLMALGAWGRGEWLGFPVNARFASLWINFENGRRRLRDQFAKMELPPDAADFIHVTDVPEIWSLADSRMAGAIRQTITEKKIRLVIMDTVSSLCEDELAKHFTAFFTALNSILSGLPERPAVLLIHHSRKPKEGDRGGRGLLNLISGHQTLQRRSSAIIYLGRVTDEFDEKRAAAVCLKCRNNGEMEGQKFALKLGEKNALEPLAEFDWSEWEQGSAGRKRQEKKVTDADVLALFEFGNRTLSRVEAAEMLMDRLGIGRTTAFDELKARTDAGVLVVAGKRGKSDLLAVAPDLRGDLLDKRGHIDAEE